VSLDGFSGFLCDNESSFDVVGQEVTIMSWVRTSSTENWYLPMLSKGDDSAYDMTLLLGKTSLRVGPVGSTLYGATSDVRDGNWHHLCAVIGLPTNKTYVDGVAYDVGAHNGNMLGLNDNILGLGWVDGFMRQINGTNSSLTGDMDDAAVFNRALHAAEIQDIVINGVPTTSTTTTSTTSTTSTTLGLGNLIGHWRFDESAGTNALNDIGTGDGNAVGEGTVSWSPMPIDGKFGGYVSLDGFSGFLCNNESAFDIVGKEVTIMTWVRTSNLDNWYLPMLTKGDDTAYDLGLIFGKMHVQVDGVGSTLLGATPDIRDGTWHHLCAVLGPPTNKTYVDGVLYDTETHNGNDLGFNNSPVGLGWADGFMRPINGTNSSLTGDMDDAAIFDRTLTQAEIQGVIANGVPTTTTTSSTSTTTTTSTTTLPPTPFEIWVAQFGIPEGEDGPDDDPDSDGMTNVEEWIAGTDPNDPDDVFEIVQLDYLSGSNCIWWRIGTNTQITTPFTLWRATNLPNLVYEPIATGIARDPSGTNVYYDTNQPSSAVHYRPILPTNHP